MTPTTPFQKRIKRHITGRTHRFFVAVAPGLEALCHEELMALSLLREPATPVPGGIEFDGRLLDCYRANLHLRTANRILMRINTFKASNFRQLERKVADLPWELHLYAGSVLKIHVTAGRSRLYHKKALSERIARAVETRLAHAGTAPARPLPAGAAQHLFVRVIDDRVTLSMDSSGEILHKRGIKKNVGKAPIRETLAAAALMFAGFTGDELLADPMCGSGTFSLEAAMMAAKIPAGAFRRFAFMDWPSFRPRQWVYLKGGGQSAASPAGTPLIFSSDQDPVACRGLEESLAKCGLATAVQVVCRDFFEFVPSAFTREKGVVVLNPPYGVRLGTRNETGRLYSDIFRHLENAFQGWRLALFAPDRFPLASTSLKLARRKIYHGGLDLVLLTGEIS